MAVELLQGGTFEVPEVEVVDSQIVDQQFGYLDEFLGDGRRLHYRLLPHEIHQIVSEGQDDHVEPRRGLEVVLRIVFLLLGEER